jgi:predicted O-methyltransferase YrrM/GR25 family glycosyltransferase involved in LPS biosynthesis
MAKRSCEKTINHEVFQVNENEFAEIIHKEYFNLKLVSELALFERIVSLLNELSVLSINSCIFFGTSHGGYIPIKCSKAFDNIVLLNVSNDHKANILKNIETHVIENISWLFSQSKRDVIFSFDSKEIDMKIIDKTNLPIILSTFSKVIAALYDNYYQLTNSDLILYVPSDYTNNFYQHFHFFVKNMISETGTNNKCKSLNYDNLIHLCVMVKDGGSLFEQMLIANLDIIDRWTILDTGSTDGTIDMINRVLVGKKKGNLYQEPFINFRESRNRCLDLAGTSCKFNVMLDDTYCVNDAGNWIEFLNTIRSDQFGNSYSIFIKSYDVEYYSNRITKSHEKWRYIYKVHEIINDKNNMNVGVPNMCFINDLINDSMMERSTKRKEYDFKCLFEMVEEEPDNPRHVYYIAQSYKMISNYEKAVEYYYKRFVHPVEGFIEEKYDALFEFIRISIYQLNKPFEEYEKYYHLMNEMLPTRPESNYFTGIGYYTLGNKPAAYDYFKKAFKIGFPYIHQNNIKPEISFKFTPYYLVELCYIFNDFALGLQSSTLYLQNNKPTDEFYNLMVDWHKIYLMFDSCPLLNINPIVTNKPIFCFVVDGGFTKWTGKNILTDGVGGSETWAIEMARYVNQLVGNDFQVIVFCNCEEDDIFEGVRYMKLSEYLPFIMKYKIQHAIISRYSEYIPVTINSHVENIHVILHDLQLTGKIIPIHSKIKNFFCLSEWHKSLFLKTFPQFTNTTHTLHYGIDFTNFLHENQIIKKNPYSFIYSSFPNRGLIIVLKMWPKIIKKYPQSVLNIFTDVNNEWANTYYPNELKEIKALLEIYNKIYANSIINHGWVNKRTLSNYWKSSQIWFYPCKYEETFCLTALEAALTKTLVISNNLAGLEDTIGDRGVVIPGDVMTEIWQSSAFDKICEYLDNPLMGNRLIQKNYEWALTHSWKDRAIDFLQNYIMPTLTLLHLSAFETPKVTLPFNSFPPTLSAFEMEKGVKEKEQHSILPTTISDNITFSISELENQTNTLDKIDKIYYINLSDRTDRNSHFIEQCATHNIPLDKICRFEAVNGETYLFSEMEKYLFRNCDYLNMLAKLKIMGNQLSHYNIFLEMIKNNYQYIIICQDDVVFKNGFCKYIDNLMSNIDNVTDAEIIHLGFHNYACRDVFLSWDLSKLNNDDDEITKNIVNNEICKLKGKFDDQHNSNNSLCYIITRKGAQNYVNYIIQHGFMYGTDFNANFYLINKDIYYGSRYVLATSNPRLGSDIFPHIYNNNNNDNKLTANNYYLNYNNLYNWTNDLPPNTDAKLTFVKMLSQYIRLYNNCQILEIGTYVGTSVIGMLQYLPFAKATTIDKWNENQPNIENIFYDNIKTAEFTDRITILKGDSCDVLIDLIKQNKTYDIINITNKQCLDCYTDCLLAWKILNKNGLLIIDEYLYKQTTMDNIFDKPFYGVNHFLEKIEGGYTMLEKGYRLFLLKN